MGNGMLTDRYELTMLDAALADGTAQRRAVFEAFCRRLPEDVTHGVAAGMDRLVDAVMSLRFDRDDLVWLESNGVVSDACLDYLRYFRFTGTITAFADGDTFDANTPLVTVEGTFAECVLLETLILSILNHSCTIATHAAAIRAAAGPDVSLIEMGSRRTHEEAAVDAAYAAIIGGFDATSNLAAGERYGCPTVGTAAHAWTLAHTGRDGERDAFAAQIASLGARTTLLVDTYDIPTGIDNAVAAARAAGVAGPGAIRIDSGDLAVEATKARSELDDLGAVDTKIIVSGDLDAATIRGLRVSGAPIDGYGVGTRLVAAAPLGVVYKLVEISDGDGQTVPVAKASATPGKATIAGRKTVEASGDTLTVIVGGDPANDIRRRIPALYQEARVS